MKNLSYLVDDIFSKVQSIRVLKSKDKKRQIEYMINIIVTNNEISDFVVTDVSFDPAIKGTFVYFLCKNDFVILNINDCEIVKMQSYPYSKIQRMLFKFLALDMFEVSIIFRKSKLFFIFKYPVLNLKFTEFFRNLNHFVESANS